MAEQKNGKSHKWLWLSLGAILLAAVVVLGVFLLGGGSEESAKESQQVVLYWNVNRKDYAGVGLDGDTGRPARSDGYYWVRLAVGGQQDDFPVANRQLVQKMDQLDVMALEFDENGVIIGVKNINECTGGLVASILYVESVEGNTLHCNTQGMFRGTPVDLQISDKTEVYDVGQTNLLCGIASQVQPDDEIKAIRDYDGNIIYIFRSGYREPGPVYWNLERKFNSTTGYTTREPNSQGYYEYQMAFNGEVVTVRTRDMDVANAIDKKAARCTGLVFDENGDVIGVTNATKEAGGKTFASWARVMEVNQEQVYAVKMDGSNAGEEFTGILAKNCKIINTCGIGGEVGSYTDVRYGDQVHGLTDSRGKIGYLFIVSRLTGNTEYKLYWNCERKYDKEAKVTTRTPAADGYYYIDVATGGEKLTVKTNDKSLATKLDSYAARCFVMQVDEDNNILGFQNASSAHGGSTFGSWYYVDAIDGQNLTVSRILTGDTQPTVLQGVMASDVEIINGSDVYKSHTGEYSQLKVGDRVHCLKDLSGKVRVIFIVEREVPGPVYWNITKMAVKNGYTTRQRAEDGYFYFTMAANGKQVTLKTKDIALATKIDNTAAKCMGLTVSGDVILKHHNASAVAGCQGSTKSESWVDVTKISGRTYTCRKDPKANVATAGQYFTSTMTSGCKVYNVSGNYNTFCGEETTLRVGDRIHVLHNKEGFATVIFVVDRKKQLDEQDSCLCNADVTWEAWDGTTPLENGKYYYLTADVTAPSEGFLLEGVNVSLRLDGHTISSQGRCFYLRTDSKLNICDHETRGKLIGAGVDGEAGGVIRLYAASCTLNLWNVDVEFAAGTAKVKEGGLISTSGTVSIYNCNLTGGTSTGVGGNVRVNASGTFRMFGGTAAGGKASSGDNLYNSGRLYLENATMTGGSAAFKSETDMVLKNAQLENAALLGGVLKLSGANNMENLTISAGNLADGGITGGQITVTAKPETSMVVMTGATETGFKALQSFKEKDYSLTYDAKTKQVTMTCIIVPQTHETDHCACLGSAQGVGSHSCTQLTGWKALTADILVESPTSGNLAFPESGNYYLTLDLELTQSVDILPGQEITLCLNGCQITDSKRLFRVNGTLNLTDCTGSGIASGSAALAPVFYTYAGGEMNLFGGTLTTTYTGTASTWGGVGAVANDAGNAEAKGGSVFNMYGGTILGGKVYKAADGKNGTGGAVMVMAASTSEQVFNLYGGTIVGGQAEVGGSAICASGVNAIVNLLGGSIQADENGAGGEVLSIGTASVTLGGQVQVATVALTGEAQLKLQDLALEGEAIGIRMEMPGVFAETETDLSARFTGADENYGVFYSGGKLRLDLQASEDAHVHCLCGDTALGEHECANMLFEPWESGNSLPTQSGSYYLTQPVILEDPQGMLVGTNEIYLCLNGFSISAPQGRAFYLKNSGGKLTVCNHGDEGGVISAAGVAGESGGIVRIGSASAEFTAYNVTLRRTDEGTRNVVTEGGVVQCSGKLNLYGCAVENGYANKGGNINMSLTAKVNLVETTVTGGTAVKDAKSANGFGGNIHVSGNNADNAATLTLANSRVTGGSAQTYGNDISLGAAEKNLLILTGSVTVDGLYMTATGNVQVKDLDAQSVIGLAMKTPGQIGKADADMSGCFRVEDTELHVIFEGGKLVLTDKNQQPEAPADHQNHCLCAGAQVEIEGHTCQDITWTALTQAMFDSATDSSAPVKLTADGYVLTSGGYYYLQEDIAVTKSIISATGEEMALCLNGKNLHGEGVRTLYFQGTLHLCDCGYTDETVDEVTTRTYAGSVTTTSKAHAHIFYARSGASFYFYGGNLIGGQVGSSFTTNSGTGTVGGSMYMYGGTITGGDCTANGKSGGNVRVDGVFEMYAGLISGGKAKEGGNISIASSGTVLVKGGTITGGDCTANDKTGGNVRVDGTLEMYAGLISGGKAKEGGNIAIASSGTVLVKGGVIEGGEATSGGNLAVFGTLTLEGDGVIRNGVSTGSGSANGGGNIYGYPNKTDIRINGGTIENGKSAKNGANIFLRGNANGTSVGKLTITGGTIAGIAPNSGANVHSVYVMTNSGKLEIVIEEGMTPEDLYQA